MFKKIGLITILLCTSILATEKPIDVTYSKAWWQVTKTATEKTLQSVKIKINPDACKDAIVNTTNNLIKLTKETTNKIKNKIELANNQ